MGRRSWGIGRGDRRSGALKLAPLLLVALGAISISAFAASDARRVVGDCTKSQLHPSTIVLACADYNLELTKLQWSSFGNSDAYAHGDYYANDCTPNCAAGKFHSYPVKLVVSAAKLCSDHYDDYRRATVTFTGGRPPGQKGALESLSLSCPIP
jgi:hypothetical protein